MIGKVFSEEWIAATESALLRADRLLEALRRSGITSPAIRALRDTRDALRELAERARLHQQIAEEFRRLGPLKP